MAKARNKRKKTDDQKKTVKKIPVKQFKGACLVTIEDKESGSKSILPLAVDEKHVLEVIKLDKGVIGELKEGEVIGDVIFSAMPVEEGSKIACLAELKGSDRSDKVDHAVLQLEKTIPHLQDLEKYPFFAPYLNADFMMAAIVGAPDRTLPKCTDDRSRALCSKLYRLSKQRAHIKQMNGLLFYVVLNKNTKMYSINGEKAPYTISCYSSKGARIPVPKALEELIQKNWKA